MVRLPVRLRSHTVFKCQKWEKHLNIASRKLDRLIVHATEDWYEKIKSNQIDFFVKILATADKCGRSATILKHGSLRSKAALRKPCLHIVVGHRKTQGPRVFHAHPSYIWGFWYLDPNGYYCCLLYTSPSPRDKRQSRMPSSA